MQTRTAATLGTLVIGAAMSLAVGVDVWVVENAALVVAVLVGWWWGYRSGVTSGRAAGMSASVQMARAAYEQGGRDTRAVWLRVMSSQASERARQQAASGAPPQHRRTS